MWLKKRAVLLICLYFLLSTIEVSRASKPADSNDVILSRQKRLFPFLALLGAFVSAGGGVFAGHEAGRSIIRGKRESDLPISNEDSLYCKSGEKKVIEELAEKSNGLILMGPYQISGYSFWCIENLQGQNIRNKRDVHGEAEVSQLHSRRKRFIIPILAISWAIPTAIGSAIHYGTRGKRDTDFQNPDKVIELLCRTGNHKQMDSVVDSNQKDSLEMGPFPLPDGRKMWCALDVINSDK